ncbi:PPA1309 family protein [uncultured Jatrophihabitans sp.]|uniref:PPA1309 family protein n=1 Tax=uncultured Jatrophihabitans sp. TaxID=1610747 RepID=UPI0035CC1054
MLVDPKRVDTVLVDAVAEIEAHVHAGGWDRPPALFALVRAGRFAADEPQTAARLGIDRLAEDELTPVEQGELPDQPLDELLAGIAWPDSVAGCALSQEIVVLPPDADARVEDLQAAAGHPQRREARLVVGVLRAGESAALLRLRGVGVEGHQGDDGEDDVLTGPDLAPNLVAALHATFG